MVSSSSLGQPQVKAGIMSSGADLIGYFAPLRAFGEGDCWLSSEWLLPI